MNPKPSTCCPAFQNAFQLLAKLENDSRRGRRLFALSLIVLFWGFMCPAGRAQTRDWVWMGGRSTLPVNSAVDPGVYGTLGAFAAGNTPGGRSGSNTWTDSQGRLWLFGGETLDPGNGEKLLNDLWVFDPGTSEWAWMSGSSTGPQPGVYGTLGVDTAGNVPGSRAGASSWIGSDGHFWLFGGYGDDSVSTLGYLDDLWEFNPSTNKWTWWGGNNMIGASDGGHAGAYGSLGVIAATNYPGSRSAALSWTDSEGNFWLFGGNGFDSAATRGDLNDLWEFNPTNREWVWVNGSNLLVNGGEAGVFGKLGIPDAANVPPGRAGAIGWTGSDGNLWLFGGGGPGSAGFNDLWEFNLSTGEWAWVSGSRTAGLPGVYGTLGVPDAGSNPGGRVSATSWTDGSGNLWLFGGAGYDSTAAWSFMDDVWQFNPSTGQWTWMDGSDTGFEPGVYGTLGVASGSNTPGGRYGGTSWTDGSGNFWFFGGWSRTAASSNDNLVNDLWEALVAAPSPSFSPAGGTYTASQTVTIADSNTGAAIYYTRDGTTPTANSTLYSGPITVSSTETVQAMAVAQGYGDSAVVSATYTLNLLVAEAPVLTPGTGTYTTAQSVSITDATAGATIYYTDNGSTPTQSSTLYTGPITVSATRTLKAMAMAPGYGSSAVTYAVYTLNVPTVATPVFSPGSGLYTAAQSVTISDATQGATIYYTTDGTTPTENSTLYAGPITVSSMETLQAIAMAQGDTNSNVAQARYYFQTTPTVAVTVSSTSITTADPLSVLITVTGATGSPTPSGTITMAGGGFTSAVKTLTNGSTTLGIPAGSLSVGHDALTASYTPDSGSAAIYSGAAETVSITVAAVMTTPTIAVAPSSTNILTTDALEVTVNVGSNAGGVMPTGSLTLVSGNGFQAGPTVLSGGSASFRIPGKSLPPGADTLTAAYAPDTASASLFSNATGSAQVIVTGATPAISWATPAAIYYGTALSTLQLNATASVAGTFVYSPPTGTVPLVGSDTLSVIFTPSDITNYTTAVASVTLTVNVPPNPMPVIGSLSPAFVSAGSAAFALTVTGTEFQTDSTVYWGSQALVTQYVSSRQLTAQVPATDVAEAGTIAVTVQTPAPGGGGSNTMEFEVDTVAAGTAAAPTVTASAATVTAGTAATYPVTVPPATSISVTCLNLPAGATCSYSSTTNVVTIATSPTTPPGTYSVTVVFTQAGFGAAASAILLPVFLLPLLGLRRRAASRRWWLTACVWLIVMAAAAGSVGCSQLTVESNAGASTNSGVVSLTIH